MEGSSAGELLDEMRPVFFTSLPCMPSFNGRTNPFRVDVRVWATKQAATTVFKVKHNETWNKNAYAYFRPVAVGHHLGEVHFVRSKMSLDTVTHEFVHAAQAFLAVHMFRPIVYCTYDIGNSSEECVSYVSGFLTNEFFKRLPGGLRETLLANTLAGPQ
jgi:hypothetical protein